MRTQIIALTAASALAVGCGASYPTPVQHLADAEAAHRGAQVVGASNNPSARLHLKLAQEQIAQARNSMNAGDNKRADFLLMRGKADADLALALAREQAAVTAAQQAISQADAMRNEMANPNGNTPSTTPTNIGNEGAQP